MDPAFEIAITAEHGDSHQIAFFDRPGDDGRQRAAVADAGRAAIAYKMETLHFQIAHQAGLD